MIVSFNSIMLITNFTVLILLLFVIKLSRDIIKLETLLNERHDQYRRVTKMIFMVLAGKSTYCIKYQKNGTLIRVQELFDESESFLAGNDLHLFDNDKNPTTIIEMRKIK